MSLLAAAAVPIAGQELNLWLDATGTHARPPAGVTGVPASYGVVGGRLLTDFGRSSVRALGQHGDAREDHGGQWLRGELGGATSTRVGPLFLHLDASGFGLRYLQPFRYTATGAHVRPAVIVPATRFTVRLEPRYSAGRWQTDERDGSLQVAGGAVALRGVTAPLTPSFRVELLDVRNGATAGSFLRVQGGLDLRVGPWSASTSVRGQRTPLETELGGGVDVALEVRQDLVVRAQAGRALRDPLFGTPGSTTVAVGLSFRPLSSSPEPVPPVAAVLDPAQGGRRVRFTLSAPTAERVQVTGDFSAWEPVPMQEHDGRWTATIILPPGVHHFGFLVDGAWAVPPSAPGQVEDGWGRINASIVVEQ